MFNKLKQLLITPYTVTNSKGKKYYLCMKYVSLRGGKLHPIYFFIMHRLPNANQGMLQRKLPDGYHTKENPRNGFIAVIRDEIVDAEQQDD